MRQGAALMLAALLAVAACGGEQADADDAPQPAETAVAELDHPRGGTLRVGLVGWAGHEAGLTAPDGTASYALDPQAEYDTAAWELFRCCLLRTLLSYNGTRTEEGGAEPRPDLASEMPAVSDDGLTWTFRLKPGLRYAPPYEDTEIVASDVVRAVERMLRPANPSYAEWSGSSTIGTYSVYYTSVIAGAEAFAAGEAGSISGLEAPDDHTLVVHLTQPSGDVGHRFSLPATAPIPPGADDGHDAGYGPFLVASGPYMLEDYEPGGDLVLVRNPSWSPAVDELRAAYADRIELPHERDAEAAYRAVDAGQLDLVLNEPAPPAIAERYQADPELKPRLLIYPQDGMFFAAMNLAQPPFDDVHVRRAANLAVDKAAIRDLYVPVGARIATHFGLDSQEGNLLLDYDPYATTGHRGDLAAARAAMAASPYDTDGDGLCDRPECSGIRAVGIEFGPGAYLPDAVIELVRRDLEQLGLDLVVDRAPPEEAFPALAEHAERYGIVLNTGWVKDFPNGSGWFTGALDSDDPSANPSLVGIEAEQLEAWGYPVTSVLGVDDELAECLRLVGGAQTQCWAALDQLVMEQIVPLIPYVSPHETRIVSARVAAVSIDQLTLFPSLDRIALEPGS